MTITKQEVKENLDKVKELIKEIEFEECKPNFFESVGITFIFLIICGIIIGISFFFYTLWTQRYTENDKEFVNELSDTIYEVKNNNYYKVESIGNRLNKIEEKLNIK